MSFRYIGVTDDTITCERCGKTDLKSTVILAILDPDGSAEDVTYYGSDCAATALQIPGGGRKVLAAARAAHEKTVALADAAQGLLAFYGLPQTGDPDPALLAKAARQYRLVHINAQWAAEQTLTGWRDMVTSMIHRRQAEIRDAGLLSAR